MASKIRIAKEKVDKAKQALIDNPHLKIRELSDLTGFPRATAQRALKLAKEELAEEQRYLATENKESKELLAAKQHEAAVNTLLTQINRLADFPEIIDTLKKATFTHDKQGRIKTIKKVVKGYTKDGTPTYLTPGSLVKEFMDVTKQAVEMERLITGIAAAERATAARAGATNISLSVPISPNRMAQVKPAKVIDTDPHKPEDE